MKALSTGDSSLAKSTNDSGIAKFKYPAEPHDKFGTESHHFDKSFI